MRTLSVLVAMLACGACSNSAPAAEPDAGHRAADASSADAALDAAPVQRDAARPDAATPPPDASADAASDLMDGAPPACGIFGAGASQIEHRITHDGLVRSFIVYTPSTYDASATLPVVVGFNGRDGTPEGFEEQTRLSETAEAHGFILVYPRGSGGGSWNGGVCCGSAASGDVDDVGFVDAMLDELSRLYCVDTTRVYATGLSNGGFMSNRVGCELADRFAAIAPVAGMLLLESCPATAPVAVLHMHGTADYIVPYGGNRFIGFPSVATALGLWRAANGCEDTSTTTFEASDVRCELFDGCDVGGDVELCTVTPGGHTWPGGYVRAAGGYTTRNLDANEYIWDFFTRYTRE